MITRKMLLASCAVGVMGLMTSPAFAQSTQGGTPSDAAAATAGQANPTPPQASPTGAEVGTPGATGTSTGSAISGDTAARSTQSGTTSSGNSVQEVVVTAEKRSVSIQRIPAAVTAFTSEKRDLIGITNVQDLTNFTPGLQYSTQIDRPSLRGIGRLTNVQSAQSPLATYSDGVYSTSVVEAGKSPLFVDRIEVLRGPQGTLYGRNAIAGAINVLSRRPTNDWYGEIRVHGENYGHSVVEGAISGPIIKDYVSFRLAGSWDKQRDGWIKNIVPGQPDEGNVINQQYYEGQLKVKFNDRLEGWFKLSTYIWNNGSGGPGGRYSWYNAPYNNLETSSGTSNLVPNSGFGLLAGQLGPLSPTNVVNQNPLGAVNPQTLDPRKIASIVPYRVKLDNTYIPAGELIYHADNFDVKYVGGGVRYHYYLDSPPNPNAAPISQYNINAIGGPGAGTSLAVFPSYTSYYQEVLEWQSHELNIISTKKGPFQYVLGAYYFGEHEDQPVNSSLPQQAQLASPSGATCFNPGFNTGPGGAGVCPPNTTRSIYNDTPAINIHSKAAFAQLDWEFAPTLKTTLGVRYTRDDEDGTETGRLFLFGSPTSTPPQFLGAGTPALDLTQLASAIANPTTPAPGVVGQLTFDPATGFATRRYDASWDAVTGTAGLQWEPQRGTLVFAKYSRGYKAGGYRLGIDVIFPSNPLTNPESVNAYELGLKKSWLNRTLTTNVSGFYYDYQNAQIPVAIAASSAAAAGNSILFNVPKSVNYGVELETVWNPVHNLNILFNYSYLDAHVTEGQQIDPIDPTATQAGARPLVSFAQCLAGYNAVAGTSAVCPLDIYSQTLDTTAGSPTFGKLISTATGGFQRTQELSGNNLPNSAHHKVAFNANYTINTRIGDIIASGSYSWRAEQFGSIWDRSYYRAPSSGQLDARVTFRDKKDRFTIIAYGRNITDEIVYEGGAFGIRNNGFLPAIPIAAGGATGTPVQGGVYSGYYLSAPRTYGIELQYRFF